MSCALELEQQDPRVCQRKAVNFQATVEYQQADSGWRPVQAWVTEISAEGMRLLVPRDISLGARDVLRVYLHKPGIEATGKVSHVTDVKDSHVLVAVGLRLTEISRDHYALLKRLLD